MLTHTVFSQPLVLDPQNPRRAIAGVIDCPSDNFHDFVLSKAERK